MPDGVIIKGRGKTTADTVRNTVQGQRHGHFRVHVTAAYPSPYPVKWHPFACGGQWMQHPFGAGPTMKYVRYDGYFVGKEVQGIFPGTRQYFSVLALGRVCQFLHNRAFLSGWHLASLEDARQHHKHQTDGDMRFSAPHHWLFSVQRYKNAGFACKKCTPNNAKCTFFFLFPLLMFL